MQRFTLLDGTRAHYLQLASIHYRDAHPAVIDHVIRAVTTTQPRETVGVVVIAYPTLASAARNAAIPNRFNQSNRTANARCINAHVRTISRLIVDPRFRGLGLGSTLVRAAITRSKTRYTEAIASMARLHPVFDHAGMRMCNTVLSRDDRRLQQQLQQLNIQPEELCEPEHLALKRHAQGQPADIAQLRRAIQTWKRASPRTFRTKHPHSESNAPLRGQALIDAMHEAAARLCFPPLYFIHDKLNPLDRKDIHDDPIVARSA